MPSARLRTEGFIKASKRLLEAVEALKYRDARIILKDELGSMASIYLSGGNTRLIRIEVAFFFMRLYDMQSLYFLFQYNRIKRPPVAIRARESPV